MLVSVRKNLTYEYDTLNRKHERNKQVKRYKNEIKELNMIQLFNETDHILMYTKIALMRAKQRKRGN